MYSFAIRRNWFGLSPAVFPSTSLIIPSFQRGASRLEVENFLPASGCVYRAEVTAGVQRAVGFRRLRTILDVALRYRFAYSLEHYDSVCEHADYPLKHR